MSLYEKERMTWERLNAEKEAVLGRAEHALTVALGELDEASQYIQFGIKTEFAIHLMKESQSEIRKLLGR